MPWQINLEDRLRTRRDGRITTVGRKVTVSNDRLYVEWLQSAAWTLGEIRFECVVINQLSGSCGSVVGWNGRVDGTGHGYEYVERLRLILDGKAYDLIEPREPPPLHAAREPEPWRHERLAEGFLPAQAHEVRVEKTSWFGPFRHEAVFIFNPHAADFTTTHHYRFVEDFGEGWTNYRYVFMRMFPATFDRFIRWPETGPGEEGKIDAGRDTYRPFTAPMRALALYDAGRDLGVVLATPTPYPGDHHLQFRADKDIKFRSILFSSGGYQRGDELTFSLTYTPFRAPESSWRDMAEKHIP